MAYEVEIANRQKRKLLWAFLIGLAIAVIVFTHADWKKLIKEVRDSHWMMAYGDYIKEIGYASRKIGIEWVDISET